MLVGQGEPAARLQRHQVEPGLLGGRPGALHHALRPREAVAHPVPHLPSQALQVNAQEARHQPDGRQVGIH